MPTDIFPPSGYFLRIKEWETHFECAQTRKVKGPLRWISLPTQRDGLKFSRLMALQNATSVFGAFILLVEIAAAGHPRGSFWREHGDPMTALDFQKMTGIRVRDWLVALKVLTSHEIGWLEVVPCSHRDGPTVVERSDMEKEKEKEKEGKGEGEVARARGSDLKPELTDREFFDHLQQQQAYKSLDVRAVWDKLEVHCDLRGEEATRGRLIGWLNRERPNGKDRGNGRDETDDKHTGRLKRRVGSSVKKPRPVI